MLQLNQALAVLRARRSVELPVGHLPSEANTDADALSRLEAPGREGKSWPASLAANVRRRDTRRLPALLHHYGIL